VRQVHPLVVLALLMQVPDHHPGVGLLLETEPRSKLIA
jgi:hypothetical protein